MSLNSGATQHIPPILVHTLETQLGAKITHVIPRAGNGASRQGAEVLLHYPEGHEERGYLSFDPRLSDTRRRDFFRREVAILAALSGPLGASGVAAPRLLASDIEQLALLTEMVPGADNFSRTTPPEERLATENDAIVHLARLHRIDPSLTPLDGFDDPALPNSERIARRISELRAHNLATAPDPILLLALDWLERHIPDDTGACVIVHGDAGPGNFLHADGKITALLDWELVHFGDPMEDLAQMWVRAMFNPFMGPSAMFAAYEEAGGEKVDLARVRFHRLYFQIGFMVANHANLHGVDAVPTALIGTTLLFEAAHMSVVVRSLAELSRITLDPIGLPEAEPGLGDRVFELALVDLREIIVPRAPDQQARAKATSLARLVKLWRNRDRYGALTDQAEIASVSAALNEQLDCVADARRRLAMAIAERQIDFASALRLCHRRAVYQVELMGDAMGALRNCYFAPLDR